MNWIQHKSLLLIITLFSLPLLSHAETVDKDGLPVPQPMEDGPFVTFDFNLYSIKTKTMTIGNSSGFPSPADRDIFTGSRNNNPVSTGVTLGWFWEQEADWFPAWYLGLRYKYLFSKGFPGTVLEYSLPKYANYTYEWTMESNILLIQGKINVFRFNQFLPWASFGAGAAFNRSDKYSEKPIPGVTPRINPAFRANTHTGFSYAVGAGVDFECDENWVATAGYEFQYFGDFQSGTGTNTRWFAQSLSQSGLYGNSLILSLTYRI